MPERMWRKGNPPTLLVGIKLVQPLWKTVWRFLKKLKIELPYDPAIPLLGIYPDKTLNLKRYMHPNVHSSTIYIAKTWKQPKCPSTDEWIKKMWYIYIHIYIYIYINNGILLSHKKAMCNNWNFKSHWRGSTVDSSRQKKELANQTMGQ